MWKWTQFTKFYFYCNQEFIHFFFNKYIFCIFCVWRRNNAWWKRKKKGEDASEDENVTWTTGNVYCKNVNLLETKLPTVRDTLIKKICTWLNKYIIICVSNHMIFSSNIQQPVRSIKCSKRSLNLMNINVLKII